MDVLEHITKTILSNRREIAIDACLGILFVALCKISDNIDAKNQQLYAEEFDSPISNKMWVTYKSLTHNTSDYGRLEKAKIISKLANDGDDTDKKRAATLLNLIMDDINSDYNRDKVLNMILHL